MDAPCIVASLCCVVRCTVETFLRARTFGGRGVLLDTVALRRFLDAVHAAAVDFFVQTGRPVPEGGPPVLGMVSPGGPRAAEQRAAVAPGAPRRGQGWLDLGPYPPGWVPGPFGGWMPAEDTGPRQGALPRDVVAAAPPWSVLPDDQELYDLRAEAAGAEASAEAAASPSSGASPRRRAASPSSASAGLPGVARGDSLEVQRRRLRSRSRPRTAEPED